MGNQTLALIWPTHCINPFTVYTYYVREIFQSKIKSPFFTALKQGVEIAASGTERIQSCHGSGNLLACLWSWRLYFDSRPARVQSDIDKVLIGQVFVRVLQFFPVRFIPLARHTHILTTGHQRNTFHPLRNRMKEQIYKNRRIEMHRRMGKQGLHSPSSDYDEGGSADRLIYSW